MGGDRKRQSIRLTKILGKVNLKLANEIKAKVESLNAAAISRQSWDRETADWVGNIEPKLYDRLAEVGLVPKRAARERATLGPFLESYIDGRSDVKGGTAVVYGHAKRCLAAFFGDSKPLAEITPADADDWRRWLANDQKLADNTVRRRCGIARQFFRAAVRRRLIAESPFAEMKGVAVKANRSRDYFVSREEAAQVLSACPDAQWRLLFALSRYGGLRCPSEHLALKWGDVNWDKNRLTVTSPKTEHHDGQGERAIPIFAELRPYLEAAYNELVEDEDFDPQATPISQQYVIRR